ncbi:MAG: phosphatase PAP2 family protein [Smithellaceae bacterium]|nr:phosphatase PAP2 family protein [Smithellaceae bacterium]
MDQLLNWGVVVIVWLQQASPALDLPFKVLTFLGTEVFYIILLPVFYWTIDRRTGARLAVLFLVSAYCNALAKNIAHQPRPFAYDARVKPLAHASGGGLPSGHTQNTVVTWGYLAQAYDRRWLWMTAATLMILVPLSRLYLGVHFPTDLLGGYVLGFICLTVFLYVDEPVERWLLKRGLGMQLAVSVFGPLLLFVLFPGGDEIAAVTAATLMGLAAGVALERRFVRFEAGGTIGKRVQRLVLGFAVLMAIRFGLKAALAGLEPAQAFTALRYFLMGAWIAVGAPWVFVRIKWMEESR